MKNKVYTYICVYEHISGEKTTLVFTGLQKSVQISSV